MLDDFINISDQTMEDPYTLELPKNVKQMIQEKGYVDDVLIIGGGDCLILNHLLSKYPQIKHITHVELDKRVVENVMQWFNKFKTWVIQENLDSGRLEVIFENGAEYVKKALTGRFDAVIIDCTDTWSEDSPSYVLTTVDFYQDVYRILKNEGGFSQMCSCPTLETRFRKSWTDAGFRRAVWEACPTPQYGGFTPFGYVYKQ